MQHWSIEVQHMLGDGGKTMFSLGYFGSKGTHLIGVYELNEVPPGVALNRQCATGNNTLQTAGAVTAPCQVAGTYFGGTGGVSSNVLDQIRPFRGYRSITMLTPQFNSNYNSLQGLFQHRFTGASQVNVAYTWAKNLTDNQTDRSTAPMNSYDIKADYGRATLDRRHILTTNYIYELPFYKNRHDLAGSVLGGWQVSGIFTYQTGLPFTALGANFDGAGLGNVSALVAGNRPISLCDPNAGARNTFELWFNTQCFQLNPTAPPVPNIVSNTSRGTIEGPPTVRFDFSLFKNMEFGEDGKVRLQLRGEFFNIFNHTNFRAIQPNITAATYGQVITVRDPRTIQIGAKLSF